MRTVFLDIDKLYNPKRVVTNHHPLTKDKKFTPDGLFSEELFGKKNSSETLAYSCECGNYKGKFLKGKICDNCGKPVKKSDTSLKDLVWIDLGNNYIINPVFYYEIAKLAGGPVKLNKIINYDKKIDKDGNVLDEEKGPYDNIGLYAFKENFLEILRYFYDTSKYKDKALALGLIFQNYRKIFISKIPVFDPSLRPATITYKDKPIFKFDEINNNYNFIIQYSNTIKKSNKSFDLVILPYLYSIQNSMNLVFNKVVENLAGKSGFIRSNTLGNRVNFSARNVITPIGSNYNIDEIAMPYLTFIELYSFQLMNLLCKLKKISLDKAKHIILDAQANFNKEIYDLACELINKTKYGCTVIGIRNPTIARGSILYLKIAKVKMDYKDLTVSVHNSILKSWAGDYDGDVVNFFPIMDNEFKKVFYDTFSPDKMFISNNDGRFNKKLALDRDQVIGIHQFNS